MTGHSKQTNNHKQTWPIPYVCIDLLSVLRLSRSSGCPHLPSLPPNSPPASSFSSGRHQAVLEVPDALLIELPGGKKPVVTSTYTYVYVMPWRKRQTSSHLPPSSSPPLLKLSTASSEEGARQVVLHLPICRLPPSAFCLDLQRATRNSLFFSCNLHPHRLTASPCMHPRFSLYIL